MDLDQPLEPMQAHKLMRRILAEGTYELSAHAEKELAKDRMNNIDAVNVIRAGVVEPPEWENGEWRYRVRTSKMYVVVAFNSDTELAIVTGWRLGR
jgi:hypothetical protein